ncbi:amino acid adenylation domain-containing protein [Kitasatospora sp. NBC_01287]|uniref:non-ribosomal peptide synthetase n=1 Tax=Kitasatospora sp. NBC_01287 TaxID=2903573 RepID=UPI002251AAEC|nr:amino acid adenylation domain-containing protein [Kitasatospora sp. NBC_01287]MCX4750205.1 amino acid adenylation domain-containing protein [Kitasatospora sp. NBC_01287]
MTSQSSKRAADRPSIPAGAAQQGVWLTERLGAARESYHLPLRISFRRVDPDALARACAAVLARHPALTAVLAERDGTLYLEQSALPAEPATVEAGTDSPAELAKRIEEETARPFALDRGPLARFTLYRGAEGRAELLVVAHHVVFDGISKSVLVADLAAAYNAFAAGGTVDREPVTTVPVAPAEELVREAARWFAPRWTDAAQVVLPGVARAAQGAGSGQTVSREVDPAALAAAAASAGVTSFEFLLTAVHAVLGRYGNAEAPVALSLSTRGPEQAAAIGLFVNELPHHAPPVTDQRTTFAQYAAEVRGGLRELYRFRTVPFGEAVGGLSPRVGLTQVSVGYRRRGAEPVFEGADARVDWMVFNRTARNTLHIQVVDAPDSCTVALQFDPRVLAPDVARRISAQLGTLLDAAVAAPETPLGSLPLLDAAELRTVTETWNATARAYPADRTLLALFEEHAARTPGAVAVSALDGDLTYAQLSNRSTELAAALAARGIGRGALVALYLDRTSELLVALLGVLKSGAAYLPLDPGYPEDRLSFILADSGAALLLANREPSPEVAAAAPAVLRLAEAVARAAEPPAPLPGDLAYVLYTSGSTGRPKGVEVGHRALVNLLSSFGDRLGSGAQDVWLGLTSLSFDISGLELFLPLITGGRLVLAPDGLAVDGPGLLALIQREGVTHVQATPSGWRVLLTADLPATELTALVGGEALPLPLAARLRSRVGRLLNVYGPTETTIWSTCAEVPLDPASVGIGRPIANTRAYVLDEQGRPLPIGIPGELHLGGDGVARGYLGRPELTAERFIQDPFGQGRLYRTGDLAAWNADGELDFLGRLDNQVKIRGHRIEPGEIEARLLEHPELAEAAVTVDQDGSGEPRLVGYLVTRGGPAPSGAQLREHLLRTLPGAMVPQLFVPLAAMPLTPNGKLDRKALPAPPEAAPAEPRQPVAGAVADPVHEALRAIWSEVLGIPDIGIDEDLFDLGAHSLMIIQISARIRKVLGVELDFDVFFDTSTVAGIAEAVKELQ